MMRHAGLFSLLIVAMCPVVFLEPLPSYLRQQSESSHYLLWLQNDMEIANRGRSIEEKRDALAATNMTEQEQLIELREFAKETWNAWEQQKLQQGLFLENSNDNVHHHESDDNDNEDVNDNDNNTIAKRQSSSPFTEYYSGLPDTWEDILKTYVSRWKFQTRGDFGYGRSTDGSDTFFGRIHELVDWRGSSGSFYYDMWSDLQLKEAYVVPLSGNMQIFVYFRVDYASLWGTSDELFGLSDHSTSISAYLNTELCCTGVGRQYFQLWSLAEEDGIEQARQTPSITRARTAKFCFRQLLRNSYQRPLIGLEIAGSTTARNWDLKLSHIGHITIEKVRVRMVSNCDQPEDVP